MKRFSFIILLLFCAMLFADPSITGVYFDGRIFQSGNSIGRQPEVEVRVSSSYEIPFLNGLAVYLDNNAAPLNLEYKNQINNRDFVFKFVDELPTGWHELKIEIQDDQGYRDILILNVNVLAGRDLHGDMVVFPSPATSNINICYELGSAQSVSLLIYDLNGQIVCRRDFIGGYLGGNGGYNQVKIDLDTHSRRPLSNGVYIAVLLRKSGSRSILAREKFIVLR